MNRVDPMDSLEFTALQLVAERNQLYKDKAELILALIALEQAYTNKHSPQYRLACRLEARAIIDKAKL
jgi:hypothetical protein